MRLLLLGGWRGVVRPGLLLLTALAITLSAAPLSAQTIALPDQPLTPDAALAPAACPAGALTGIPGAPGNFRIDGTLVAVADSIDWFSIGGVGTGVMNYPPPPFDGIDTTFTHFQRDSTWAGSSQDIVFGTTGNKDEQLIAAGQDPWTYKLASGYPGKDDITEIYVHTATAIVNPLEPPHRFLYVGLATRTTDGTKTIGMYYLRAGVTVAGTPTSGTITGLGPNNGHTNGDFFISTDWSNGGALSCAVVRQWSNTVYVAPPTPPPGTTVFYGESNFLNPVAAPYLAIQPLSAYVVGNQYQTGQFSEMAIDLTAMGISDTSLCGSHAVLLFQTRSSNQLNATLKDLALVPFNIIQPPPVSIDGPSGGCVGSTQQYCETASPSLAHVWSVSPASVATIVGDATGSCVSVNFSGSGTATLSVKVTSPEGCSDSTGIVITGFPNPAVSVNSPQACQGTEATLTATVSSGTSPFTYLWSPGGATTSSISVGTAGTYTVTVTDAKGCTGTGSGTLTVNPNPSVSVNSPQTCQGTETTLTATVSSGTGPFTYLWSPGGATTSSILVGTAGTYSVTVTDSKGCTGSGSGVLTVNPNPSVSVNSPQTCQGTETTLTATVTGGTGPFTYLWSPGGATTSSISVGTAGTYTVTVTDSKSCTGSGSGTLTVNPNPSVSVNSPQTCQGTETTLTATVSSVTGPFTYLWSPGGATTSSILVGTAGTYSVTVTDSKGCTGSGSGTLTVNPKPEVSVNSPQTCQGTETTLTATVSSGTGPFTYLWSPGGATTSSILVGTAGTYTVTVTDSKGYTGSGSGTLTVNPSLSVSVNSPQTCQGTETTLTATVTGGTGPFTYLWSPGGATTSSISVGTAGTYSVSVTDSKGCTGSGSGTLTVNPKPSVSVNSTQTCTGTEATLTATVSSGTGPFTYLWSPGGATTSSIQVGTAGTYTVTVTDSKGCTGSGSGELTVNGNPTVTVNSPEACEGAEGTLTATVTGGTEPFTYLWSPGGATTSSISVGTAGAYTVTVTDSKGCTGSGSGTLTVNPNPVCSLTAPNPLPACLTPDNHLCVHVTNGVAITGYEWSVSSDGTWGITGGETDSCVTYYAGNEVEATFKVVVTSAKGCKDTCQVAFTCTTADTFCTLTQGAYGNINGQFIPGENRLALLQRLITPSDPLVIGIKKSLVAQSYGSITIPDGSEQCVIDRMPAGGPPAKFPALLGDRTMTTPNCTAGILQFKNGRFNNVFIGQIVALSLNSRLDVNLHGLHLCRTMQTSKTTIYFKQSLLDALTSLGLPQTVAGLLELANRGISGLPTGGVSISDLASAVGSINEGFDECAELLKCIDGEGGPVAAGGGGEVVDEGQAPSTALPTEFALSASIPNPFSRMTTVRLSLPERSQVRMSVFNILGQEVARLAEGEYGAGVQTVQWSAVSRHGSSVAPGVYFLRVHASGRDTGREFTRTQKVMYIR